jgi:hypothetical protein
VSKQAVEYSLGLSVRRTDLESRLATAHGRIEKRFLEGGAVLISIVDILGGLIRSLDLLTGSLDDKTTSETTSGIRATVQELAGLADFEGSRRLGFERLAKACDTMQASVVDMRETIRYLRTFAVTVKITAAGLSEFAGFADEIGERIQFGAAQCDRFAEQLREMHAQLKVAQRFSGSIVDEYTGVIPEIMAALERDAALIFAHHGNLAALATQVKVLAQGVQMKIAQVLSALQIGDISRQRIEHIQSIFALHDAFVRSAELDEMARDRIGNAVYRMVSAHMEEIVGDFQRECRNILGNMSRFVDDTRQILSLRDAMREDDAGQSSNALHGLEANVREASALVARIQQTGQEGDRVANSTMSNAQSLIDGVEIIRAIKTDIHYMALNSNLRCSRVGDDGRSVNVVSAELRIYAAKLEEPADAIMAGLQQLESTAQGIAQAQGPAVGDISQPLDEALVAIRRICASMDDGLSGFEREGQEVFTKVSAAIATLDFESELGEELGQCAWMAEVLAGDEAGGLSDMTELAAGLSAEIYKVYTMAQERDVHRRFLPVSAPPEPVAAVATDDDLFADALF